MRQLIRTLAAGTMAATFASSIAAVYGAQLDEVTVFARKTEENLQEVPQAITAVGAEEIDRLGIIEY